MADLSGATSVGGVIVPIGLDLAHLQGDAGKARQILDQLDKGAAGGGTTRTVPIKFASVQETTQEFTKVLRPLQPVAEQEGEKIGRKLSEGIAKGHEGHSALARKNLLSARGLEGLGVGGSATAAFGLIEAMKIAGDIAEAQQITGQRILDKAVSVGSSYSPDAGARQAAESMAESQRYEKVLGAIEGIPIVGNLFKIGLAGVHADLQDEQLIDQRSMQASQMTHDRGVAGAVEWKEFQGDRAGAAAARRDEELAKDASLLDTKKKAFGLWAQKNLYGARTEDVEAAAEKIYGSQLDAYNQRASRNRTMNRRDEDVQIAGRAEVVVQGEAAKIRGAAIGTDSLNQLKENQRAAAKVFDAQTAKIFAQTPDAQLYDTMEARRQERAEQEKKDSEAVKQKIIADRMQITEAVTQGDAAQLQSHHQLYAATLALAKNADEAELTRLRAAHADPDVIAATEERQRKVADAKKTEHDFDVAQGIGASQSAIGGAILRSQRQDWAATVLERNAQQQRELDKMDPDSAEKGWKQNEFTARNLQADIAHKFELSEKAQGIQAGTDAALYERKEEPGAAQVRKLRESARSAVENAAPELREAVRNEQRQILENERHKLFDPHSGGYAAMESSYFLPGDPLRAGQQARDRADEQNELDAANQDINNAGSVPKDVAALVELMQKLLDKATGFVQN
jgi:hypothetical protein